MSTEMLYAGSADGVYRIEGLGEPGGTTAERVLEAELVYRLGRYEGVDGLFAAGESGLYHSPDGTGWTALPLPAERVYAVAADPSGGRLYAGTRPARVFVADVDSGVPTGERAWRELEGFAELRARADWGIPRHDGLAQVRSLRTHPAEPDRLVAGVEVGGVHVSDDGGATWADRRVEGFDAPHIDDVHHVTTPDSETLVVSTGSGLFRSTDVGRTWDRLDTGLSQRYVRESFVHDGTVYAGVAPGSSSSWETEPDQVLLECREGGGCAPVASPVPDEVAIGFCEVEGDVVAATHRGTLLRRTGGDWRVAGSVPTSGRVRGLYLPLTWDDG